MTFLHFAQFLFKAQIHLCSQKLKTARFDSFEKLRNHPQRNPVIFYTSVPFPPHFLLSSFFLGLCWTSLTLSDSDILELCLKVNSLPVGCELLSFKAAPLFWSDGDWAVPQSGQQWQSRWRERRRRKIRPPKKKILKKGKREQLRSFPSCPSVPSFLLLVQFVFGPSWLLGFVLSGCPGDRGLDLCVCVCVGGGVTAPSSDEH